MKVFSDLCTIHSEQLGLPGYFNAPQLMQL